MLPILHAVRPRLQFCPALPWSRWLAGHPSFRMILLKIGPPIHFLLYESLPYWRRDHGGLADDLVQMVSRRVRWSSLNGCSGAVNLSRLRDLHSR